MLPHQVCSHAYRIAANYTTLDYTASHLTLLVLGELLLNVLRAEVALKAGESKETGSHTSDNLVVPRLNVSASHSAQRSYPVPLLVRKVSDSGEDADVD
jgi:hypothetical protein